MAAFGRLRAAMSNIVAKYPLGYNMVTVSTLYTCGDICQHTVTGTPYDWPNTGRIAFFAFSFFGPVYYKFYKILDKALPGNAPKTIAKKMLADQLIGSSFCTAAFFVGMSVLERQPDVFEEVKAKFLKTYAVSCMFWPGIQLVNFWKVPPHMRATYVSCAAFVWTNVLCYVKSMQIEPKEEEKSE